MEKEFYKTLSRIKNKDPTIYDKDTQFFECEPSLENNKGGKKKATPLTLRDYERKLILEKGGELSDDGKLIFFINETHVHYVHTWSCFDVCCIRSISHCHADRELSNFLRNSVLLTSSVFTNVKTVVSHNCGVLLRHSVLLDSINFTFILLFLNLTLVITSQHY